MENSKRGNFKKCRWPAADEQPVAKGKEKEE